MSFYREFIERWYISGESLIGILKKGFKPPLSNE
jgi:hypothetical protein